MLQSRTHELAQQAVTFCPAIHYWQFAAALPQPLVVSYCRGKLLMACAATHWLLNRLFNTARHLDNLEAQYGACCKAVEVEDRVGKIVISSDLLYQPTCCRMSFKAHSCQHR
eukprot:723986-Amphidinium_carterae.1